MGLWKALVIAGAGFFLTACTQDEYVAVVGVGEVKASPTKAAVMIEVEGVGKDSAAATADLADKVSSIIEVAEKYGVTRETVEAGYFYIEDETESHRNADGSRQTVVIGKRATQIITLRTDQIDQAGDLLGDAIKAGAEGGSQPVYLFDDVEGLFEEARKVAIADAQRRAEDYAIASNKALGEALVIEESGTQSQRLEFQLRDRLSRRYRQEEVGGEADGPIEPEDRGRVAYDADIGGGSVFSTPEDVSVTISIYAKFALQ